MRTIHSLRLLQLAAGNYCLHILISRKLGKEFQENRRNIARAVAQKDSIPSPRSAYRLSARRNRIPKWIKSNPQTSNSKEISPNYAGEVVSSQLPVRRFFLNRKYFTSMLVIYWRHDLTRRLADGPTSTRPSGRALVAALSAKGSQEGRAALEEFYRLYCYPVYAFIRRRGHGRQDAQDLTHGCCS